MVTPVYIKSAVDPILTHYYTKNLQSSDEDGEL